jgi:urease accessory protein
MWCEAIVRNAAGSDELGSRAVDYVDIHWDQRRSTLKARSRGGEEVRVLLPRGQSIRHGDVLFEDEARLVVVNVLPCEVIVVRCSGPRPLAELALELGNLHWPTQVTDTEIIFPEDPDVMATVQGLGLNPSRETRRFEPLPVMAIQARGAQSLRILRSTDGQDNQ